MAELDNGGGAPSAPSDFVSKLYAMLENPEYRGVVGWNDSGESFVILDTQRFQALVIPQVFNHSNFSSFVRQLNKYDFHKVRFRDPSSQVWEFQHADFRPENRSKPHLIRRKPPTQPKKFNVVLNNKQGASASSEINGQLAYEMSELDDRVSHLELTNQALLKALKMQQSLVERLLNAVNIPDNDDDFPAEQVHTSGSIKKGLTGGFQGPHAGPHAAPGLFEPSAPNSASIIGDGSEGSSLYEVKATNVASGHLDSADRADDLGVTGGSLGAGLAAGLPSRSVDSLKALLAIDDVEGREVVMRFLQQYGCYVEVVPDGLNLVQRAETGPHYDFIVADVVLSALDGLSAAELIRQTNIKIPIIMLAEQYPPPNIDLYILRGASAVLVRPFSKSELWHILAEFTYSSVYDGAAAINIKSDK